MMKIRIIHVTGQPLSGKTTAASEEDLQALKHIAFWSATNHRDISEFMLLFDSTVANVSRGNEVSLFAICIIFDLNLNINLNI